MTKQEVEEKVLEIVRNIIKSGAVSKTTFFYDEGADSLDLVEIAMNVEKTFGIGIDDIEVEKWASVSDVIETVINQLNIN